MFEFLELQTKKILVVQKYSVIKNTKKKIELKASFAGQW